MNIYEKLIVFIMSIILLILTYIALILKTQQESITAFTSWYINNMETYEDNAK